jgi:exopolyphosphatase/guanosine-5'-triphosphate,3'-diphosphate pyrophosphatase
MDDYNRELIESTRITAEKIRRRNDALWSMPFAERQNIPGLPAKRADVILTGVSIFEAVVESFGFSELRVSTRGLRFAALMK